MTTAEDKYIVKLATSRSIEILKRIEEINLEIQEIDKKEKMRERDLEINQFKALGDVIS